MAIFIALSIVFGALALISLVFLGIQVHEDVLLWSDGWKIGTKCAYRTIVFASLFIIFAAACVLCAVLPMYVSF